MYIFKLNKLYSHFLFSCFQPGLKTGGDGHKYDWGQEKHSNIDSKTCTIPSSLQLKLDKIINNINSIPSSGDLSAFYKELISTNSETLSEIRSSFLETCDLDNSEHMKILLKSFQKFHSIEELLQYLGIQETKEYTQETIIQVDKRDELLYGERGSSAFLDRINDKPEDQLTPQELDIKHVLMGKKFDDLTPGDFYALKQSGVDLSKLLLVRKNGDTYESVSKDSIEEGNIFTVNYGSNSGLRRIFGAGDILDITKVVSVKINGVEGKRKYEPRPGYYSGNRYLPIFDGYQIEITSISNLESESIKNKAKNAAQDRYENIRGQDIYQYINTNFENSVSTGDGEALHLPFKSSGDRNYLSGNFLGKLKITDSSQISYDPDTSTINTTDGFRLSHLLDKYNDSQGRIIHMQYETQINDAVTKLGVPQKTLVELIYNTNPGWDTVSKPIGNSTGFGLGKITDDIWSLYGNGLERNNPGDQLIVVAKHLKFIKESKNCSWDLAKVFYHIGPDIINLNSDQIDIYYNSNPHIISKIPNNAPKAGITYFMGALVYYNGVTYKEAVDILRKHRPDLEFDDSYLHEISDNSIDGFISTKQEKNKRTGVSLCSKTARLNLERLLPQGIKIAHGYSSLGSLNIAKQYSGYNENINELLYADDNLFNVIDLYLGSSNPKYKQYGHRAVAVRTSNSWQVYDPYFKNGNDFSNTQSGIPWDYYLKVKKNNGIEFKGGVGYTAPTSR